MALMHGPACSWKCFPSRNCWNEAEEVERKLSAAGLEKSMLLQLFAESPPHVKSFVAVISESQLKTSTCVESISLIFIFAIKAEAPPDFALSQGCNFNSKHMIFYFNEEANNE